LLRGGEEGGRRFTFGESIFSSDIMTQDESPQEEKKVPTPNDVLEANVFFQKFIITESIYYALLALKNPAKLAAFGECHKYLFQFVNNTPHINWAAVIQYLTLPRKITVEDKEVTRYTYIFAVPETNMPTNVKLWTKYNSNCKYKIWLVMSNVPERRLCEARVFGFDIEKPADVDANISRLAEAGFLVINGDDD
jgi:hypothetical protein